MAHWEYIIWAVNALVGCATWRNIPLAVIRVTGALTKDPERAKRCAEILRLARKDAQDLPSYLLDPVSRDGALLRKGEQRQRRQALRAQDGRGADGTEPDGASSRYGSAAQSR